MYVQQVLTHGASSDIREMFHLIGHKKFLESFQRIRQFIPKEIRNFWESGIDTLDATAKGQGDTTIVHIALDSPFRFEPPIEPKEIPGLFVDSLVDLATNKLLALFGNTTLTLSLLEMTGVLG